MKPPIAARIAGFATLLIVGVANSGCGSKTADAATIAHLPPAPPTVAITAANQKTLFPLALGDTWAYQLQIQGRTGRKAPQSGTGEITMKVTKSNTSGDDTTGTIEVSGKNGLIDVQQWHVNSNGVYEVMQGKKPIKFSPEQPVMLFPIDKHSAFSYSGKGPVGFGNGGSIDATSEINLAPKIDIVDGSVSGVSCSSKEDFNTPKGKAHQESTQFFQPGVGLVRVVQSSRLGDTTTTIVLRLISSSVH